VTRCTTGGRPRCRRPSLRRKRPPLARKTKAVPEPALPEAKTILVCEGASKAYGDLVALAPLDLRITAGSRVALVGHNGSGKSTLLRLAAGLLELTAGSIEIDGQPAGSADARAAVTFIPDDPVLYDDLSVREHLAYIAALHGVDAGEEQLDALLARIGLLHRADDLPARFSRGLRQRTSIAIGLVRPFEVLLVDEPFVGLDASGKEALLGLLDEIRADGSTVIVATHDAQFVERVERCVALRDGELIHDGTATPDEVLRLVGA
jgi:ABC-2 type transport system ATP-binding protein